MDIARLNVKVEIQRRENASDGIDNRRTRWETVHACHAAASESGAQREAEGADVADDTEIAFTVRWCRAIAGIDNTSWRVIFEGRAYDITGIDHMGFRRRSVKLLCKRSDR